MSSELGSTERPETFPSSLQIRMLGALALLRDGVPLRPTRTRKGQWLLALLILHKGQPIERSWLARTLWPDSPSSAALENLRTSLKDLKDALGPDGIRIESNRHTVTFALSGIDCDLVTFDDAIAAGDAVSLERAVALYHGPLVEGCEIEAVLNERGEREQAFLLAMETLAREALIHGHHETAITYLRRALALDPFRESSWRVLMQAFADRGDIAAVTGAYQELAAVLSRTIDTKPDTETTELYNALCAFRNEKANRPADARSAPIAPPPLPLAMTPILGREAEIDTIVKHLAKSRLVTLTGVGGAGKTRLAIAIAERLQHSPFGPVSFLSLVDVGDPARLTEAIRDGLGLPRTARTDPFTQIVAGLSHAPSLLILDNFEHLLDRGTSIVQRLLGQVSPLRILVTSRHALRLFGEQEYPVPPLPTPIGDGGTTERIVANASVQVFLAGARSRRWDFRVTDDNASTIARLCQRLDGLPLAIELASAWTHLLTPGQILARLQEDRFALLTGTHQDMPERHRTMRATIAASFRLLDPSLVKFAAQLSLFHGGWTVEAAGAVCHAARAESGLRQLVDASLLTRDHNTVPRRYRYLDTIREYAAEQLTETARRDTGRRYREYFLRFAEEAETYLNGPAQAEWMDRLDTEHDNLRAVLARCLSEGAREIDAIRDGLRLAAALYHFWEVRGYYREGEEICRRLLEAPPSHQTVERARVLYGAGALAVRQEEHARAKRYYEEALSIFRERGDKAGTAMTLNALGSSARSDGDLSRARTLIGESLALRREMGDRQGIANALGNLGNASFEQGDMVAARQFHEEALQIRREIGDRWCEAISLHFLGHIAWHCGDYNRARSCYRESRAIRQMLGDRGGAASSLLGLAQVAREQGEYAAALALTEESLQISRSLGEREMIALAFLIQGLVACGQGAPARNQPLLHAAHATFQEYGSPDTAWVLLLQGMMALEQGDFPCARTCLHAALPVHQARDYQLNVVACLEGLAAVSLQESDPRQAMRLWGAAIAWRSRMGVPLPSHKQARQDEWIARGRSLLGEDADVLLAAGRAMTLTETIADVLSPRDSSPLTIGTFEGAEGPDQPLLQRG